MRHYPVSVEQIQRADNPSTDDFRRATAAAGCIYVDNELGDEGRRALKRQLLIEGFRFEDEDKHGDPISIDGLFERLLMAIGKTGSGRALLDRVVERLDQGDEPEQ